MAKNINNSSSSSSSSSSLLLPEENTPQTRAKHLYKGPLSKFGPLVYTFSHAKSPPQRTPPVDSNKTHHVRLITIAASHYCEKARWALDLLENDQNSNLFFTEDCHPPVLSAFAAVPATKDTGSSVPVVIDGDQIFSDSTTILRHYCPFLYPEENDMCNEVLEYEEYLDKHLGPTVRAFIYDVMLHKEHLNTMSDLAGISTSKIESLLFRTMLPKGLANGMRRAMKVNHDSVRVSEKEIRRVFENASRKLKDGKHEYLFANQFTAADLTFSALASLLVMPPELEGFQVQDSTKVPVLISSFRDELRNTPAGKHALRMYELHRFGKTLERCHSRGRIVCTKSLNMNRVPRCLALMGAATVVGAVASSLFADIQSRL